MRVHGRKPQGGRAAVDVLQVENKRAGSHFDVGEQGTGRLRTYARGRVVVSLGFRGKGSPLSTALRGLTRALKIGLSEHTGSGQPTCHRWRITASVVRGGKGLHTCSARSGSGRQHSGQASSPPESSLALSRHQHTGAHGQPSVLTYSSWTRVLTYSRPHVLTSSRSPVLTSSTEGNANAWWPRSPLAVVGCITARGRSTGIMESWMLNLAPEWLATPHDRSRIALVQLSSAPSRSAPRTSVYYYARK